MQKRKLQILTVVSGVALMASLLSQSPVHGAISTIVITQIPFISFNDIPDSFLIAQMSVPTSSQTVTSDPDGSLGSERFLTIRDTRNCGGLNLQLDTSAFSPTAGLNSGLRTVTSAADLIDGVVENGVKYLSGFAGTQGITAPLNVNDTTFSDPALFTDPPFNTVDNILNGPVDLLQGPLTAPAGRNGYIHIDLSFSLDVPAYTIPGVHYTTLTYTLADDTAGTC
ncbi:MAG TPA: hypothetical protein VI588_04440 [Candidatus Gracilibacteria bacterium]|nr:hypothetical protein [Candidatus Gracilibacteria bacterium]